MSCNGRCFDFQDQALAFVPEWPTVQHGRADRASALSRHAAGKARERHLYTPLQAWQTRLLCLYPSQPLVEDVGWRENQLQADLLVVDLPPQALEGVRLVSTDRLVEYTAISYTWGPKVFDETLLCNGIEKPITRTVAAILQALRHPTEAIYVWIDQLCINQQDNEEKSKQVATMLDVYRKAYSVVAWLGEPDQDSALAFNCIWNLKTFMAQLQAGQTQLAHSTSCLDHLQTIYSALLALYNRPYLSRTWIRQEIYGARRLTMQCGPQQAPWDDYYRAADLLEQIPKVIPDRLTIPNQKQQKAARMLSEAQRNAAVPRSGVKQPRELIEVLRVTADFGVSDDKDTFYAVLGMCSVPATTPDSSTSSRTPENAVVVNYNNSLADVYTDASLHIMAEKDLEMLSDLFDSYRRSPSHSAEPLPSWAVDWRSCESRPYKFDKKGRQEWLPLRVDDPSREHDMTAHMASLEQWRWPEPTPDDRKVLCLRARFLNYIAFLSDHTCDVETFLLHNHGYQVGSAGLSVHAHDDPGKHSHLFTRTPRFMKRFKPEESPWRLALLGVGNDSQICLVPASAQKGDLVVAVAPSLLPVVLRPRPCRRDAATGALYNSRDPYNRTPYRSLDRELSYWIAFHSPGIIAMLLFGSIFLVLFIFAITESPQWENPLISNVFTSGIGILLVSWMLAGVSWALNHMEEIVARSTYDQDATMPLINFGSTFVVLIIFLPILAVVSLPWEDQFSKYNAIMCFTYIGLGVCFDLWLYLYFQYKSIESRAAIALRRRQVYEHLDRATEEIGRDYELHGQVYVQQSRSHWSCVRPGKRNSYLQHVRHFLPNVSRRMVLRLVMALNRCLGRKINVAPSEVERLFREMFIDRRRLEGTTVNWERPMQNIRVH